MLWQACVTAGGGESGESVGLFGAVKLAVCDHVADGAGGPERDGIAFAFFGCGGRGNDAAQACRSPQRQLLFAAPTASAALASSLTAKRVQKKLRDWREHTAVHDLEAGRRPPNDVAASPRVSTPRAILPAVFLMSGCGLNSKCRPPRACDVRARRRQIGAREYQSCASACCKSRSRQTNLSPVGTPTSAPRKIRPQQAQLGFVRGGVFKAARARRPFVGAAWKAGHALCLPAAALPQESCVYFPLTCFPKRREPGAEARSSVVFRKELRPRTVVRLELWRQSRWLVPARRQGRPLLTRQGTSPSARSQPA